MRIFINNQDKIRPIWWAVIFFLVLALLTIPLIILSQKNDFEITMTHQAVVIISATWISQKLQKKQMSELFGKLNMDLVKNAFIGLIAGLLLMLIPAIYLKAFGYVHWNEGSEDVFSILKISWIILVAAVAEEVLFRGFIFQQLQKSTGIWIAQLLIAAYFLLTHMNNPGMTGGPKVLASINIFLASIMFGLAYVRSNSLIMPIAFHFMANWIQGPLLGFGVSGNEQSSLFNPNFISAPEWLTGGSFGLEASVPGLLSVITLTILIYTQKQLYKT